MGGKWAIRTRSGGRDARRERREEEGARSDAGMTVVEVIVAIVVFMLVMVPFAALLAHSDSVITNAQNSTTASGVLNSEVIQAQNSTFPGTWTIKTTTTNAKTHKTWPSAPTATEKVNAVKFGVFERGGWCVLNASTHKWGTGTVVATVPATYHVVVKVLWHSSHGKFTTQASTNTWFVRDSTELPSNDTKAPPTGTTLYSCPLSLR